MEGWIKINRDIMDDENYLGERFDKTHAWLDLLLMAEPKPRTIFKRGIKVNVGVGEVAVSMRQLSERWGWYLTGVLNFIKELQQERKIEVNKTNVISVLQILNWKKYQAIGTQIGTQIGTHNTHTNNVLQEVNLSAVGTEIGTQTATQPQRETRKRKEAKEIEIRETSKALDTTKETANAVKKTPSVFKRPTEEEVQAYINEKGYCFDAAQFCDFYASKGWKVGSSPMKDWRAAVRNWARRDASRTAPATPQRTTPNGIVLGVGEFIDPQGRRTYGTGLANIPAAAPPRPSAQYAWNAENQSWIIQ